jgi:hypothetical protein
VEPLFEVFGQMVAVAARVGFAPWARLFDRGRPRARGGLSWTTRAASVIVLVDVTPMLLFLFFLARLFVRASRDDFLLIVGLIILLPIAAVAAAAAICLAGLAALAATELLEGNATARWMTVGWSVVGVVVGAGLSLLDPPTLGYLLGGFCALEVVLLVLPATAEDFSTQTQPTA